MAGGGLELALPILGNLVGSFFEDRSQRDAAKRQQAQIAEADRIASEKAQRARATVLTDAQRYSPETRAKEQSGIEQSIEGKFSQALRDASPAPVNTLGATSSAYQGATQSAAQAGDDRAGKLNQLLAKTLAPGQLAVKEGIGTAGAGEEAGSLFSSGRQAINAGATDASRITPSPVGAIASGVIKGVTSAAGRRKDRLIFPDPYSYNQEFTP